MIQILIAALLVLATQAQTDHSCADAATIIVENTEVTCTLVVFWLQGWGITGCSQVEDSTLRETLTEECPATCGLCDQPQTCEDVPSLVTNGGTFTCPEIVQMFESNGLSGCDDTLLDAENRALLVESCPLSCGFCGADQVTETLCVFVQGLPEERAECNGLYERTGEFTNSWAEPGIEWNSMPIYANLAGSMPRFLYWTAAMWWNGGSWLLDSNTDHQAAFAFCSTDFPSQLPPGSACWAHTESSPWNGYQGGWQEYHEILLHIVPCTANHPTHYPTVSPVPTWQPSLGPTVPAPTWMPTPHPSPGPMTAPSSHPSPDPTPTECPPIANITGAVFNCARTLGTICDISCGPKYESNSGSYICAIANRKLFWFPTTFLECRGKAASSVLPTEEPTGSPAAAPPATNATAAAPHCAPQLPNDRLSSNCTATAGGATCVGICGDTTFTFVCLSNASVGFWFSSAAVECSTGEPGPGPSTALPDSNSTTAPATKNESNSTTSQPNLLLTSPSSASAKHALYNFFIPGILSIVACTALCWGCCEQRNKFHKEEQRSYEEILSFVLQRYTKPHEGGEEGQSQEESVGEKRFVEAEELPMDILTVAEVEEPAPDVSRIPMFSRNPSPCSEVVDNTCSICETDFQVNENITTLPCSHRFHMLCLIPYLRKQSVCPVCRQRVKLYE